jgi:hypothetical protein
MADKGGAAKLSTFNFQLSERVRENAKFLGALPEHQRSLDAFNIQSCDLCRAIPDCDDTPRSITPERRNANP